jgi:hypothetical protein
MKIEEAFGAELEVETQNWLSVSGAVMRKEVMLSCYHYTQSGTHALFGSGVVREKAATSCSHYVVPGVRTELSFM